MHKERETGKESFAVRVCFISEREREGEGKSKKTSKDKWIWSQMDMSKDSKALILLSLN